MRKEEAGKNVIWAAIAKATLLWCLQALKPEEVNTEPCKRSSDDASVRALLCRPTGCIFFIYPLQAKTLRSPSSKHYNYFPSPSHSAHPLSAQAGESKGTAGAATQSTLKIKQHRPQLGSLKDTF